MHEKRLANLLGAASLALSDLMLTQVREAGRVSASGAAALVVLAYTPGLSVTELGRRIGLSQPATARMVDSLETSGLVQRGQKAGRTVSVELTTAGRRTVREVRATRDTQMGSLLAGLDPDDRAQLERLLEVLLTRLYNDVGSSDLLCRLCDRSCCTDGAICPVGQAERDQRR
ncbi:MarR family transcriptional regulator [Pseudonocardia sulfidoxydans NBRC 16205]|uniref:MarR family transcriptional regulator n=1 Tax=Pseudonocardia sulfidoxydans NBRC 16205 TaxID=1223511 RepID=A0A511DH08_9PSEU|nr:MarR family transcriptional regulator [Pseudonocardia sulfidoxydans]GEL24070.1 MarR family transcriptional regulator [Pseudonocardia sulfidoxydans NBRC 16205]